jgi:hypothetical protein
MRTRTVCALVGMVAGSAACGGGSGGGGGSASSSAIGFSDAERTILLDFPPLGRPAVGHFDADALVDVAIGRVQFPVADVAFGLGDGTFDPAAPIAAGVPGESTDFVRTAFLNLDAFTDLVVADGERSFVQTFLGRGDGRFDPGMAVPLGFVDDLGDVEVGPLDGDVLDDVVVSEGGFVHVYRSVGDGTLVPFPPVPVGGSGDVLLARLESVGTDPVDLLVANEAGTTVHVFEGQGNGTFLPLALLPVPEGPRSLAVTPVDTASLGIVVTTQPTIGVRVFVPAGPGYDLSPQGFVPLPGEFAGRPVVIPAESVFDLPDVVVFTADLEPGPFATHVARLRLDPAVPGTFVASSEDWDGIAVVDASVADVGLDGRADLVMTGFLPTLESFLDVRFGR